MNLGRDFLHFFLLHPDCCAFPMNIHLCLSLLLKTTWKSCLFRQHFFEVASQYLSIIVAWISILEFSNINYCLKWKFLLWFKSFTVKKIMKSRLLSHPMWIQYKFYIRSSIHNFYLKINGIPIQNYKNFYSKTCCFREIKLSGKIRSTQLSSNCRI